MVHASCDVDQETSDLLGNTLSSAKYDKSNWIILYLWILLHEYSAKLVRTVMGFTFRVASRALPVWVSVLMVIKSIYLLTTQLIISTYLLMVIEIPLINDVLFKEELRHIYSKAVIFLKVLWSVKVIRKSKQFSLCKTLNFCIGVSQKILFYDLSWL